MNNCAVCHKPVVSGLVVHSECWPGVALDNKPLTIEELRKMDGEPVWVVNSESKQNDGFQNEWAIVSSGRRTAESVGTIYHFENYFDCWLAYRRKPREWISVKDWLPPEPDESIKDNLELPEYIVMVRGATESTVMHYAGNGEWIYAGDPYPVTHWMPMPEPPEVGRYE